MWLLGLLASLALVLAATGLFSLLSYFVSQRTHEIGIRMALGAQRRDIFQLVLGQGAILLAAGIAIGLARLFHLRAFVLKFVVRSQRHRSFDIHSYSSTAVACGFVGLLCSCPARHKS